MKNKKYVSFDIKGNELKFYSSFFGVETVILNNKEVSKKTYFCSKSHKIKINNEYYIVRAGLTILFTSKITLLKDGKIVDEKKYTLHWSHIVIYFILIILFGLILYYT